ncbi:hypothetical protein [Niveibacterium sp. SC-1]|uniref:hypothetical protein n=1 Tax=Niveibacterium sp. SC-1 TaxID=3135646 RepID=UPI00311DFA29
MRAHFAFLLTLTALAALPVRAALPAPAHSLAETLKGECVVAVGQSRNPPQEAKVDATRDKLAEILLSGFSQGLQEAGATVVARFYPTSADDLNALKARELESFAKTQGCKWLAQLATVISKDQKLSVSVSLSPVLLEGPQKDKLRIGALAYGRNWNYALSQKFMDEFKPLEAARGYARDLLASKPAH